MDERGEYHFFPYLSNNNAQCQEAEKIKRENEFLGEEHFVLVSKYGNFRLTLLRYEEEILPP
jgi:hypothetical protein